jgi:alkylhydroperoxidase family enzyme
MGEGCLNVDSTKESILTAVLSPIERPRGLLMKIAFFMSRRQFGKVLSALKVLYVRKPGLALIAQKIATMQSRLSINADLKALVQVQTARINGCTFCENIALAQAFQKKIGMNRFAQLPRCQTSTLFTDREKAALALTEHATRTRQVPEAVWLQVKKHFSEVEIVELVWLNAAENYFNLQAAVLGLESDGLPFGAWCDDLQ